jgi:hypothetical protein
MGLPLPKTNGLFAKDADGRLLFFASPTAKSAYVVPDFGREDALRTLSRYWGLCELFSIALVAPIAVHFGGAVGLLLAFAVFAVGSPIGYVADELTPHCSGCARVGLDRAGVGGADDAGQRASCFIM